MNIKNLLLLMALVNANRLHTAEASAPELDVHSSRFIPAGEVGVREIKRGDKIILITEGEGTIDGKPVYHLNVDTKDTDYEHVVLTYDSYRSHRVPASVILAVPDARQAINLIRDTPPTIFVGASEMAAIGARVVSAQPK